MDDVTLTPELEEAVQARILELEAEQAKAHDLRVPPESIEFAIDEAVEWVRRT